MEVADQPDSSGTQHAARGDSLGYGDIVRDVTIGDLLREAAQISGNHIALVDGVPDPALRRRWTYTELLEAAEQVAYALLARFNPGDRIAVFSPNCPEWVMLQYGTALAGMVLVPANPAYREAELTAMLQDCGAVALFHADSWRDSDISAMTASIRETALPDLAVFSFLHWDAFLASADTSIPMPLVQPGDPVMIQFTSGTTGRPKGAILHHRLSNPPRYVVDRCKFPDRGVWLNSMPMYHIGGSSVSLLGTLSRHGTFVQMREWDPVVAMTLIEAERCCGMLLVPTMIVAMLDHPDFETYDLSSIDFILSGASAVPPALLEQLTERVGCALLISFGMTESGGPTCNTAIGDGPYELGNTLGRALPNVQIEIRDPETCEKLPVGTMGEMWFKGYQIMLGYYGREEETRAAITPDGWLRSGDLGKIDERGYVSITGRLKDMIIRGGMNVYPREIEDALFEHPFVAQAAVIGIPDDKWGEIVLAVVQAADGQELSFEELFQHCRQRLAKFKVPSLWCKADSFPVNPTGKIQKFVLADWVREGRLTPVSVR